MDQISQHINIKKHRIIFYNQKRKIMVNSGSKKDNKSDDSSSKITDIQNYLVMSIFDTPEKDVSNSRRNSLTSKVYTSSAKSSYSLF